MKSFFDKTEYTQEDILELIEDEIEESLNLDFKRAESLEQTDGRKKEIAKDVSSFANSDGGIIVYGIEEGDYKATGISFIDGEKITKEWLEQVINSDIHRRIKGIEIYPIRFDNDIKKTVYVVKIPASNNSPHMAKNFRYYKRSNFETICMDEYEVRQAYQKRENTKMIIGDIIFNEIYSRKLSNSFLSDINYILGFQVKNVGNVVEKLYKLEIHIPKKIYSVENQTNSFYQRLIRDDGNTCVFSIPNYSPIFQRELTTVCSCVISLNYEGFKQLVSQKIKIKLYYTSGLEEKVFDIAHKLTYNEKPLNINNFGS